MTRMSKQARERHACPRKRKPVYKSARCKPQDSAPTTIAYKCHINAVESSGLVFIPKIG